jgi:hypothetical protein
VAYVLLPSLKNPAPGERVPTWNHYVCYDVLVGPLLGEPVILVDQFGDVTVQVLQAKYFCNPADKTVGGKFYPMTDAQAHLACYAVENPDGSTHSVSVLDQFRHFDGVLLLNNDCLCAPAYKDYPVRSEKSTWGKIKSLYRN